MVFSISSKQSLTELKPILELITEVKGNLADIPLVLVGNKNDEEAGPREVPYKTGETLQVMIMIIVKLSFSFKFILIIKEA